MINSLKGLVIELSPANCVIECAGVGYNSAISLMTYQKLNGKENKEAFLFTSMIVREDAQLLYGFYTKREKELFRLLISVNGVGPSSAMMILSTLDQNLILRAIQSSDAKTMQSVKGIGAKTAQRIIIDLKDKIDIDDTDLTDLNQGKYQFKKDALIALEVLGTPKHNAEKAIDKLIENNEFDSVEALVKAALKNI